MRRYALFGTLVLAGCVDTQPAYLVHKTGSAPTERMSALTRCEVIALQAVPRAMATQMTGGYYNPGSIQCNTFGSMTTCNRVGAVNIAPTAYSYDANQELRMRVTSQCLNESGFDVFTRPRCVTDSQKNAYRAASNAPGQPPADQIPCVII